MKVYMLIISISFWFTIDIFCINSIIMIHIAHRGCIDKENTIQGVVKAFETFDVVEVDVRYNSYDQVVLCHDREKRNENHETLEMLCQLKIPMKLMLDIKAFGVDAAQHLATDVVCCIMKYPLHSYQLCSFNEYCVQELLTLRDICQSYFEVGVISSGVPVGLFHHMPDIDFISLNYDTIHEEILERCEKKIYAWVCNDADVKAEMESRYKIDGIIYDHREFQ